MHVVTKDLGLEHLWVVYPGHLEFSLADGITALPLKSIHEVELRPKMSDDMGLGVNSS